MMSSKIPLHGSSDLTESDRAALERVVPERTSCLHKPGRAGLSNRSALSSAVKQNMSHCAYTSVHA